MKELLDTLIARASRPITSKLSVVATTLTTMSDNVRSTMNGIDVIRRHLTRPESEPFRLHIHPIGSDQDKILFGRIERGILARFTLTLEARQYRVSMLGGSNVEIAELRVGNRIVYGSYPHDRRIQRRDTKCGSVDPEKEVLVHVTQPAILFETQGPSENVTIILAAF